MRVTKAVETTDKASSSASSGFSDFVLQRNCACGGPAGLSGECQQCRSRKLLGKTLQRKLAINEPGDEYEREADRVAEQVMRMPEPVKRKGVTEPTVAPLVQRRVGGESAAESAMLRQWCTTCWSLKANRSTPPRVPFFFFESAVRSRLWTRACAHRCEGR